MNARHIAIGEFLATHKRQANDLLSTPQHKDIANHIGFSRTFVCNNVEQMVQMGYLEHTPKSHTITFTAKGLRKFMPDTAKRAVDGIDTRTFADERGNVRIDNNPPDGYMEPVGAGTDRMTKVVNIPTADLILELIERGYVVKKA